MALFYEKLSLRISDGVPSEVAPVGDEVPSCWLCLDEGADELGQPLRRDCSCRGDTAGFAHLSCIVDYAKHKSDDQSLFIYPWTSCPQCLQPYQNKLAVDLTTEFVSFAEKEYQGNQLAFLAALDAKLDALPMQQAHRGEAKQTANKILSTIESMKVADSSLPQYVRGIEAEAYNGLGVILYHEGKEGAGVAIEYFEKSRGIRKELGLDTAGIESNIAAAKLRYEGDRQKNMEEVIISYQHLHEQCVAEHGEKHHKTVIIGLNLASALRKGNRSTEAQKLLTKLHVACKQLHGPDHKYTKAAEAELRESVRANQTIPRAETVRASQANKRFLIEPKTLILSALLSLALWYLNAHLTK